MSGLVVPVLPATDIESSLAFYRESLQFKVDWQWRPPEGGPAFAQISLDGMRIYISENEGAVATIIYLYVDDVDVWHGRLLEHDVAVDRLPHDTAWRNREMHLKDPVGNILRVCTPLSKL